MTNAAHDRHTIDRSSIVIKEMADVIQEIQPDSIVSRTLFNTKEVKTILFGFAVGQELSEHTASKPAILHFLRGRAQLTLGENVVQAEEGTIVQMPAHLPHSVSAETEVLMLLYLFSGQS